MRWVPAGPPSLEVPRLTVWTDGAAVFPGRVGLARAAWGVYFGAGHPRNASGQVPGTQTIQRAELYAVVAATESACPLEVVSDSRYVVDGIAKMFRRGSPPKGLHADLWASLYCYGKGGGLVARWVPSHRPAPDPPELSQLDWLGNRAADGLAGEALRLCGPAPPLRDLWESRVRLARGVARVAAAVLEASLEDLHRLATPDVRPLVRRRAGRAVGPRMRVPAPPLRRAMPPGIPSGSPPPGVHAVVRRTLPRDRVECTACGASCENPSRFHTFAYSRCPGPLGSPRVRKAPVWAYSVHSVVRRPDGDPICVRCGRRTRTTAAARFARARCVARVLDGGPEDVDWGAVLLFLAGRSGWGMPPGRAGGGAADVDGPGGPPSPPHPAAPPAGRAEGAGVGRDGVASSVSRRKRRSLGLPADLLPRPPPPRPTRGTGTGGLVRPPTP